MKTLIALFAAATLSPLYATAQDISATTLNYGNGAVVKETLGSGAPADGCSGLSKYTQTDAAAGQNQWLCVNGHMVQQGTSSLGAVLDSNGRIRVGSTSITTANAYHAFGDSITCGADLSDGNCPIYSGTTTPSPSAYPAVFGRRYGLPVSDYGITGQQACEGFLAQINPSSKGNNEAWMMGYSPLYSVAFGTNDVNVKGTGAYEANFQNCHTAMLAWLGTPAENRVVAGNSAVSVTGGFSNTPNAGFANGWFSGTSGTLTVPITTYGYAAYIYYYLNDSVNAGAGFTYAVDGGAASSLVTTKPTTPIATQGGTPTGIGYVRIPLAAGSHTIVISTSTGAVAIVGVSSAPSQVTAGRPTVLVSDVPNIDLTKYTNGASVAAQQQYTADIKADIALVAGDGIDARLVNTRSYVPASDMDSGGLHPSATGHLHYVQAIAMAAQLSPASNDFADTAAVHSSTSYASAMGTAVASAATTIVTKGVTHITGTAAIATLGYSATDRNGNASTICFVAGTACQVTLIPDGAFTTATSGNIAIASTAVVGKAMTFTYDPGTGKWYPSY